MHHWLIDIVCCAALVTAIATARSADNISLPDPYTASVQVGALFDNEAGDALLDETQRRAFRYFSASFGSSFKTYMLYLPPAFDSGSKTTWVALHEIDWNFHGAANLVNGAWVLLVKDGVNVTKDAKTTALPSWTQVITATPF